MHKQSFNLCIFTKLIFNGSIALIRDNMRAY
jgi:hypothetical protein